MPLSVTQKFLVHGQIDRSIPCHCCRRPFTPRGEDERGDPCCSGDRLEYCINCLKCVHHCFCGGKLVRGYAAAWNVRREIRRTPASVVGERLGRIVDDFTDIESAGEIWSNGVDHAD